MKTTFKRTLSAAAAALVLAAAIPFNVYATGQATNEFTYDPYIISSTDTVTKDDTAYFLKALKMKTDANVPTVTFEFEITSGTEQSYNATNGTLAIKPGVISGSGTSQKPSVGTAPFTPSDGTHTTAQPSSYIKDTAGTAVVDVITLDSGEKYARYDVPIDFTGVTFPEPGIYRYKITEKPLTQNGITNDTATTRILDVYILDKNDAANSKTLEFGGYVLHNEADSSTLTIDANGKISEPASGTKSQGFVNTYNTQDLYFAKKVTGNQGSRDKFFQYHLALTGLSANAKVEVDVSSNASPTPNGNDATKYTATEMATGVITGDHDGHGGNNITPTDGKVILVADASGNITHDFYLQHEDYIIVKGLPKDSGYALTEDREDYASTEASASNVVLTIGTGTDTHDFDDPASGSIASADIYTGFTNNRDGTVPTGVLLSYTPAAVVGIIVIAGIIFLVRKRRAE